jgi:UDP-2,3-diacylglucosamine hydrolase
MSSLFISDLHLSAATPRTCERLVGWLETHARTARDLWILGDLFEVWVGDDTIDDPIESEWLEPILHALRAFSAPLAECGPGTIRFIRGNRDFLLGERFAQSALITIVDEPAEVIIGGLPTLLLHGDTLCTDDAAYQAFRQEVRTPQWNASFLARPYAERRAIAAQMRDASRAAGAAKAPAIMDANPTQAQALLKQHELNRMIHGHTHRPARHEYPEGERFVLTDWDFDGFVDEACAVSSNRGGGLWVRADGQVETALA